MGNGKGISYSLGECIISFQCLMDAMFKERWPNRVAQRTLSTHGKRPNRRADQSPTRDFEVNITQHFIFCTVNVVIAG
jgi:hypothetical protein